jgi:hypothetical protein
VHEASLLGMRSSQTPCARRAPGAPRYAGCPQPLSRKQRSTLRCLSSHLRRWRSRGTRLVGAQWRQRVLGREYPVRSFVRSMGGAAPAPTVQFPRKRTLRIKLMTVAWLRYSSWVVRGSFNRVRSTSAFTSEWAQILIVTGLSTSGWFPSFGLGQDVSAGAEAAGRGLALRRR